MRHREKLQYLDTVIELLVRLRRQTGLPRRIVVDEAHYLLAGSAFRGSDRVGLARANVVTYESRRWKRRRAG